MVNRDYRTRLYKESTAGFTSFSKMDFLELLEMDSATENIWRDEKQAQIELLYYEVGHKAAALDKMDLVSLVTKIENVMKKCLGGFETSTSADYGRRSGEVSINDISKC